MDIEVLLARELGTAGWDIRKPPAGLSKASFIAVHEEQQVFVKLDANIPYLRRLGELEVTPRVIASGEESAVPFVIQELARGTHPPVPWFAESITELGRLIRRYHEDELLCRALRADGRISTPADQIAQFEECLRAAPDPSNGIARRLIETLAESQIDIRDQALVPIHPDPNRNNLLVADERIVLVDWDDIVLSDRLRDVGLISYWYLPEKLWPRFFEETGIEFGPDTLARLYWWAAARSLAIYFWFSSRMRVEEANSFLDDAEAAIARKPNPHAGY